MSLSSPDGPHRKSLPTAYPLTYFPGTTEVGTAGFLHVEAGKEVRADALMNPVAVAQVKGEVLFPDLPQGSWVNISAPGPLGSEPQGVRTQVVGGRFTFPNLPLGRYYFNLMDKQGRPLGRTAATIDSVTRWSASVPRGSRGFLKESKCEARRGTLTTQ